MAASTGFERRYFKRLIIFILGCLARRLLFVYESSGVSRDGHAVLETARNHGLVRVRRTDSDVLAFEAASTLDHDITLLAFGDDGVPWRDQYARRALELDVERCCEVRHQAGIRSFNEDEHDEVTDLRRQRRLL